jgi:hypothetical protein
MVRTIADGATDGIEPLRAAFHARWAARENTMDNRKLEDLEPDLRDALFSLVDRAHAAGGEIREAFGERELCALPFNRDPSKVYWMILNENGLFEEHGVVDPITRRSP